MPSSSRRQGRTGPGHGRKPRRSNAIERFGPGRLRSLPGTLATSLFLLVVVAALPWLRGEDPAQTVLRVRFTARGHDPAAVEALRRELDLPSSPVHGVLTWLLNALRGDLGTSWVSRQPVVELVGPALRTSLTLAGTALLVALAVAALLLSPTVRQGARSGARPRNRWPTWLSGPVPAALAALPEVVVAVAGVLLFAVTWRLLPVFGWNGPMSAVLPGLALGLPAGGLLARMLSATAEHTLDEPWVRTWRASGLDRRPLRRAVMRRIVAVGAPQSVVVGMSIVGSSVAVEKVFSIPGAGTLALDSVLAEDLPVVQAVLAGFIAVGLVAAALAAVVHRTLALPDAERAAGEPTHLGSDVHEGRPVAPVALLALVAVGLAVGLTRNGTATDLSARLASPGPAHPLGADAVGHDQWGRLAEGTLLTVSLAAGITLAALVVGALLGTAAGLAGPGRAPGALDVLATVPSNLVGLLVAAALGPGLRGACLAVLLVAWIPLAVHARTLACEARNTGYVRAAVLCGAGPARILRVHVLPAVLGPLLRHALVRLPAAALGIAGLSFLGLGADPDRPELGAMLASGVGYLESAPWLVLGPAGVLIVLAVLTSGNTRARGH
ncbi:ABC transporter permease subunit [Kineosporia succinea]|uniref:Peptide/nickel transport system permease protein n=1 Tax=Kineosporia succinea TaxID=84632 RepID=A0ABT9P912_9ACTN|nr:ABC transporter permease subunit [Kineosporia succinea]MDP9829195.1 peptide/nickel transport system permease protein [Kineosporia succinea]